MSKNILFESDQILLMKMGEHIEIARKRRNLRAVDIYEGANISKRTYQRITQGYPGVSIGAIMSVLHTLSLEENILMLANPSNDEVGIAISQRELKQRKRIVKDTTDDLDTNF